MRVVRADSDADEDLIYWLRYRDSTIEDRFYSDGSRDVEDPEIFQGNELETDSE